MDHFGLLALLLEWAGVARCQLSDAFRVVGALCLRNLETLLRSRCYELGTVFSHYSRCFLHRLVFFAWLLRLLLFLFQFRFRFRFLVLVLFQFLILMVFLLRIVGLLMFRSVFVLLHSHRSAISGFG
jgi:hypothetical protein